MQTKQLSAMPKAGKERPAATYIFHGELTVSSPHSHFVLKFPSPEEGSNIQSRRKALRGSSRYESPVRVQPWPEHMEGSISLVEWHGRVDPVDGVCSVLREGPQRWMIKSMCGRTYEVKVEAACFDRER
jgi:hypothetical protein